MTDSNTSNSTKQVRSGKILNIGLWVAQVCGALAFAASGSFKVLKPYDELLVTGAWVAHFTPLMIKGIGAVEVLGAIGLIVPSVTRIMPKLTVFAALGLVLVMLGAAATHVVIGEPDKAVPSVVLALLAAFIAWGRTRGGVIAPKAHKIA